MWIFTVLVCSLTCFIETKNISENNTAVLITKYSKVARWGVNENETSLSQTQAGRSSSGQALWTHRSDANIVGTQRMKTEIKPRYRFSLKTSTKVDDRNVEKIPAVGEVVQDRFNPRPYFAYGQIPAKSDTATYAPSKQMVVPPPDVMSTTGNFGSDNFDLFPAVFNVAPSTVKSIDLYTSPYSSYNPPPLKPDNTQISNNYPPTNQDYEQPAPVNGATADIDSYNVVSMNPYVSLGPPLAYKPQDEDMMPNHNDHEVDAAPSDHMPEQDDSGSSMYPPKTGHDIYFPPEIHSNGQNLILDHPPKDYKPFDVGMGSMGADSDTNLSSDMTMGLAPPSSNDYISHFPQYLYDSHHYDNYLYKEVPHTTTEGTEDKRVSNGHYSYYYLGRKLWYIPLYFSIYFIIYVTVLILKAIARHKIQYKHKWVSSARNSRTVDHSERLDILHSNINTAINNASKIYGTFAM